MIRTGSVYAEAGGDDGLRVLVTRYWPRGVKKERVDEWIRGLGPSPGLIRDWKSKEIGWDEFRERYLAEFDDPVKKSLLDGLKEAARSEGALTLLCACPQGEKACHRELLSAMLRDGP